MTWRLSSSSCTPTRCVKLEGLRSSPHAELPLVQLANVDRSHGTETSAFSFGFARVELIANLIQGTLLVALCLTLSLESLQRFYKTETVLLPPVGIGLGILALAWNIANIYFFEDAHSHGEHSLRKGRRSAQALVHPWTYRARLLQASPISSSL